MYVANYKATANNIRRKMETSCKTYFMPGEIKEFKKKNEKKTGIHSILKIQRTT